MFFFDQAGTQCIKNSRINVDLAELIGMTYPEFKILLEQKLPKNVLKKSPLSSGSIEPHNRSS